MDIKKLVERRKEMKISVTEVAKKMNVHRGTVERIEQGDENTGWKNIENYAAAIGLELVAVDKDQIRVAMCVIG